MDSSGEQEIFSCIILGFAGLMSRVVHLHKSIVWDFRVSWTPNTQVAGMHREYWTGQPRIRGSTWV